MEFYLVALNEQVKLPGESDAIGIATYSLTSHLPAAYQQLLPNEEEIRERLQGWEGG